MNREMILRVANAIEAAAKPEANPAIGFNMGSFIWDGDEDLTGHGCGTTACIAGWALVVAMGQEEATNVPYDEIGWMAASKLGLNERDARDLFFIHNQPFDSFINLSTAKPSQAVQVLRHLADTGEVDWSLTARDQTP